jgi:hypothetical protein
MMFSFVRLQKQAQIAQSSNLLKGPFFWPGLIQRISPLGEAGLR